MTKDELQQLYAEMQANKAKSTPATNSLIKPKGKKGCSTCGKVTWKPYKQD